MARCFFSRVARSGDRPQRSFRFSVFSFRKSQQHKTPANNVSGFEAPSGSSNRVKGAALVWSAAHVGTRSSPLAGVAVSGLDILAGQRHRTATGSLRIETTAVFALRRRFAFRGDHRQQRSSPRESPTDVSCAGQSRHEFSGQRMMTFNKHPASGRASALRYNLAGSSTTIFKTRSVSCGIAVRAEIKKWRNSAKSRTHFCTIWTSFGADRRRIPSLDPLTLRFPDDCQLKTAASQRRCDLRFPNGTGRSPQSLKRAS